MQAGTCWTSPLVHLLNLQKTAIFSTALVNCINSLKNIFQHMSSCVAEHTKRTEEEGAQKKRQAPRKPSATTYQIFGCP